MAPFKALLVEGTSGVGKSTLIDALLRRHMATALPRKLRSVVHLAQSHTYGPLAQPEDAGTLTVAQNVSHLERIVGLLEWLHQSVQAQDKPWCFVLLDTLHLTHCVRPGIVAWDDVAGFDRRLAALGCGLLCLQVAPSVLWERGIVPRRESQFLRVYAQKFGRTPEKIHDHFVREQERLLALYERSTMPKRLWCHDGAPDSLTEQAFRLWHEPG